MELQQISKRNMLAIFAVLLLLLAQRAAAVPDSDVGHDLEIAGPGLYPLSDFTDNFINNIHVTADTQELPRTCSNSSTITRSKSKTGETPIEVDAVVTANLLNRQKLAIGTPTFNADFELRFNLFVEGENAWIG